MRAIESIGLRGAAATARHTSARILVGLAAIFILSRILLVVVPTQVALEQQQQYFSWPLLVVTLLLGFVGWRLSPRIGIPELWAGPGSVKSRLLYPALLGLGFGIFAVIIDLLKGQSESHASFPGIIFLYTYAAILVEVLYRLFLATFVVWLVSVVILRGRGLSTTYWTVAILLTLLDVVAQVSGTYQASGGNPAPLEVIFSFGLPVLFAPVLFYLYRKFGFLAPLVTHFTFYAVWHMLWGGLVQQVLLT